jgi:hypothetical protein
MTSVLAFVLAAQSQAYAHTPPNCAQKAVVVAKENSRGSTLVGIQKINAGKSYLVGYDVAIENTSNGNVDAFRIVMMSSDCTVVSVTPSL